VVAVAEARGVARETVGPVPPHRRRFIWVWTGVWLVYLVQPLQAVLKLDNVAERVAGTATLVVFGATFLVSFGYRRSLRMRTDRAAWGLRLGYLAVSLTCIAVTTALVGVDALGMLVYVAVMVIFTSPMRFAFGSVMAIIAASILTQLVLWGTVDYSVPFSITIGCLAMWGVVQLIARNADLALAREEITQLAVADERNRFARDLHDILGHSLTVVAVKAELAGRLIHVDPDRAAAEIADVERLTRDALADVRRAVAGVREVSLAGELVNARSALDAAGIEAHLPSGVDEVPAERRELFGWAVREGVTNVIRHSGAAHCWIRIAAADLDITDDGRGPDNPVSTGGHGLAGLGERVTAAGGTLRVGRSPQGGFRLAVDMGVPG
jgi:two-component system sensor histidine kinase DesK